MEETKRTIAYICPKCKQSVVIERTGFQLAASSSRLPCPCGGSALRVEMEADHADLTVPCHACGQEHHIRCSVHDLLHRRALAFSCKATGLDCLYVGEEGPVFQALRHLEETEQQMEEAPEHAGAFLNETIMEEVLGELTDIAGRGGISCTCGSKDYQVKVHYSAVELQCARCGGRLRLPAATGEDLEELCCRSTLVIPGGEGV